MKSRIALPALAGLIPLALSFGNVLWAQQLSLSAFSADGQGSTTFSQSEPCPGLACSGGTSTNCSCDETIGSIGGTALDSSTFFDLKDQLYDPGIAYNGTEVCTPSSGTLVITTSKGDRLELQFAGPACRFSDLNWSLVGGAYTITSGTGKFASAFGTGTLSRTKHLTDNRSAVNLVGDISLKP